jgi:hypothetical protein
MTTSPDYPEQQATPFILSARLPGPDRKRSETPYCYRLTHRDLETAGPVCVFLWVVSGGRQEYQIALERDESGNLRLHCTCADAIYRAENEGRFCKHIRGLLTFGQEGAQASPSPPSQSCACIGA